MKASLWLKLVLPLTLLSAALLLIHYRWDADGLLLNLGTEIVGIVVTVVYVDWVLRNHESARWRGTKARISEHLLVFVNSLITGIRTGLKFGPDVMDEAELMSGDPARVHREVWRVAKHVLDPAARGRLAALNQADWKRLAAHLQSVWVEADRILDRFSHRLEPRQVELLLDIQESVQSGLVFWQTFPDLAGVPDDELPDSTTPPEILQAHGYDSTAAELRRLMKTATELVAGNG